jgi:O-antigen/teichoic acid export membrane protein
VTWVALLAARAFQLVTLVLLTQALPGEDLGGLLSALAAGVLGATLALGGLGDATTRQASLGEGAGFGRGDLGRALRRYAAVLPIVMLALAGITAETAGGFDWSLLVAGVLLAATQGSTTILASVFRARGQAGRFALVTGLVTNFGRAAVAGLALAIGLSAGFVLWAFILLNLAVIAATWLEVGRDLPDTASAGQGDGALHLGGAAWSVLANLDVIIVGLLLGADAAGSYGVSMRIAEFSSQFLVAISVLYLPEATRLVAANRREALTLLYRTACRWSAVTSLLIAGTGFIAAGEIGHLLFPDEPSAAALLRILFIGYGIHGALGSNYGTLVALGDYRDIRRSSLAILAITPVLTVVLVEVWGATGAAWATAVSYVVFNCYLTIRLTGALGALPFDRLYWRGFLACGAAWAAAAAVNAGLSGLGDAGTLVVTCSAALITCTALLPVLGVLTPSELDLVRRRRRSAVSPGR